MITALKNVDDDIKDKLIAKGVPEEEIAFIHDYDTAEKKQKLFDKMNAGEVRILLGSTSKCGAGMNAQRKMIALHHLDCPLRPSELYHFLNAPLRRLKMDNSLSIAEGSCSHLRCELRLRGSRHGLYSPNTDFVRMMLSHLCICTASHFVRCCGMLSEPVLECALVHTEHVADLYRRYLAPFKHVVYCGATEAQCLHYIVRCEHLHIAYG